MPKGILDPAQLRKATIAVCHGGHTKWYLKIVYWFIRADQRNIARDEHGKLLAKGRTAVHVMVKRRNEGINGWFSMEERGGVEREFHPSGEKVTYYEIKDRIKVTEAGWRAFDQRLDRMIGVPYAVMDLPRILLDELGLHLIKDDPLDTVCSTAVAAAIEDMTDTSQLPSVFGRLIQNRITPAHFCNLDESLDCIGDCEYPAASQ